MSTRIHERLMAVREGEWTRTLLAAAFFFFILFGYFLLRPARESLGVQSGLDTVRVLYFGTLIATAALNPLFSWLVSRFPRRIFVPLTYRFFMLNILAFAAILQLLPHSIGEITGRVYFVWLTVFALFNTMVFWAVMADTFTLEQSKRLYPAIAVGGTLGALAGSLLAWRIANLFDSGLSGGAVSSTAVLLLTSLVVFELGVQCFKALGRRGQSAGSPALRCARCGHDASSPPRDTCPECGAALNEPVSLDNVVIGGNAWQGAKDVLRSRYLASICAYILIMTIMSTMFYFAQMRIVAEASDTTAGRTGLFAYINVWTQLATLILQLFVTSRLLRTIGVGFTLAVLPLIAALGFIALALAPGYATIVLVRAVYDSGRFAIARPSRETLFTVVTRDQRYKAKAVIDTFVYRAGDVVGLGGDLVLKLFASGIAAAATFTVPLAALWAATGWYLGRKQRRLSEGSHADPPRDSSSTTPMGAALK